MVRTSFSGLWQREGFPAFILHLEVDVVILVRISTALLYLLTCFYWLGVHLSFKCEMKQFTFQF